MKRNLTLAFGVVFQQSLSQLALPAIQGTPAWFLLRTQFRLEEIKS